MHSINKGVWTFEVQHECKLQCPHTFIEVYTHAALQIRRSSSAASVHRTPRCRAPRSRRRRDDHRRRVTKQTVDTSSSLHLPRNPPCPSHLYARPSRSFSELRPTYRAVSTAARYREASWRRKRSAPSERGKRPSAAPPRRQLHPPLLPLAPRAEIL